MFAFQVKETRLIVTIGRGSKAILSTLGLDLLTPRLARIHLMTIISVAMLCLLTDLNHVQ
jgi:hypothetical protein